MVTDMIIRGGRIHLRQITEKDCTDQYVSWLTDPEVIQYLETRWNEQTMKSIVEFVKSQRENDYSILFAIVLNSDNRHIGNMKIGPWNKHHNHADISYFIGDKTCWNKGMATEAIHLVCKFGFSEWNLHRVEAGAYSAAVGSWKALERNGFIREAVFREQVVSNGNYMDIYRYGLLRDEFKKNYLEGVTK